ncbi:MAG TPA: thermonuclease family protein [Roseiarcus sp.]|nr:thermonuclease family protein [Roseiarcus sp.]
MKISFAHPGIWRSRRGAHAGAGLAFALALAGPASAACGLAAGTARIAEVTERLEIRLEDGRLVRLAGLDVPVPQRGAAETAGNARAFLSGRLAGREAALVAFAAGPDRWGRIPADLSLPQPAGGADSAASLMLSNGFARVRPEFETRGCVAERLAAERSARAAGLGLWNDPDYSILEAADAEDLAERDGRFVLVEGIVRRVGVGRARLYLDFGGRDGFTVVIARKSQTAFQNAGVPLNALAGEKIRVRGVLDDRFGPRLEVAEPLMVERLGRAEAKEGTKPGG